MFPYKQCIPLLAALCMAAPVFSQCDSTNHALFQIGLISPLSTNGLQAHKITNTVSVNAIGGISGGVDAFEASGVFNVTNGTVKGLQATGMFNIAQKVDHAVQAAGFAMPGFPVI